MNTKLLATIVTGFATVAVALIGLYDKSPAYADGGSFNNSGTVNGNLINNGNITSGGGDSIIHGGVIDNSSKTIENAKAENVYVGNKVFNIKTVNGDINISPEKDIDEALVKRANSLNIEAYKGFSEVFFDETSNSFFIRNHKGSKPKIEKLKETSINYKHIKVVAVDLNVDKINGDVQQEKNVYNAPVIYDNRITLHNNDNSISVGVGFSNHDTTINNHSW